MVLSEYVFVSHLMQRTKWQRISYPFRHSTSIKEPTHVTEPESFNWAMWVFLRITKLVVVPMRTHPINWAPLQTQKLKQ